MPTVFLRTRRPSLNSMRRVRWGASTLLKSLTLILVLLTAANAAALITLSSRDDFFQDAGGGGSGRRGSSQFISVRLDWMGYQGTLVTFPTASAGTAGGWCGQATPSG